MSDTHPMSVLLATDGSDGAQVAAQLAASVSWPRGSSVRVVSVMPDAEFDRQAGAVVDAALGTLGANGVESHGEILYGRPATRIVEVAAERGSDLILLGSRGHGALASMLLGSVANEVVDHAGRPVLVARAPRLSRVLLGHDGSGFALEAEQLLAGWPIFADLPIDVLSVAELAVPWHLPSSSALYGTTVHGYFTDARQALEAQAKIADAAAARLVAAGRQAVPLMADGQAAAKVIETAQQRGSDLIVVGTRGLTGLPRAVLGSVARNVLHHAVVSVLVACPRRSA